jgi:hypothetical protein
MRNKDELDLLLDSALSTYAAERPNPGLEQRVLARVARESTEYKSHRRHLPLLWSIALPATACLLVGVAVLKIPRQPSGQLGHSQASRQQIVSTRNKETPADDHKSVRSVVRPAPLTNHKHPLVIASAAARPKLDVFPTPQPLTPQEQALLRYAVQTPEAQQIALVATQSSKDTPLSIAEIRIPPLETPEEGKN